MDFNMDVLTGALRAGGLDIRYVPETGSTNADLLAAPDAVAGSVLIAGAQSAGRGRMSRSFASPEGGLYMSVLLRPESVEKALSLTPRAAVAVARAIEELTGCRTGIKWVNDVLIGGKKVCGILAEAVAGESLSVVLGIGVNIAEPPGGFPEELRGTAGTIFANAPALARERLAAGILNGLFADEFDVYREYIRRSAVVGRSVTVSRGGESYAAYALAIDSHFRLVVEREDGTRESLNSGEVSVRL